jgi:hypothetical protein
MKPGAIQRISVANSIASPGCRLDKPVMACRDSGGSRLDEAAARATE